MVTITGRMETCEFNDPFSWVVSNDNGAEETIAPYGVTDPGDNGLDPSAPQALGEPCARYDKDVSSTTAVLNDPFNITVILSNAYPCYYPTIFYGIENLGTIPGKIENIIVDENAATPDVEDNIPELTVTVSGIYVGQEIDPGGEVTGDLDIHVEQSAAECHTYTIRVTIITVPWNLGGNLGGTPGYWQNWDQHYEPDEINEWLNIIHANSDWLVPDMNEDGTIDTDDLDAVRDAATGKGATMKDRFLSQYIATRLDVEADRLYPLTHYDVTSRDPGNYLGLADTILPNLDDIIAAIECKCDTSPDKHQFEIMKNICADFNELRI